MAGLPAPVPPPATPTASENANNDEDGIGDSDGTPAARDRVGSDVVPGGDASDASGAEEIVQTAEIRSAEVASRGDVLGIDPSVKGSTPAEENRAVPVPVPRFQGAEDDGGSEGTEGSKNRTGFHSYDETHQVTESLWCGNNSLTGGVCTHVATYYVVSGSK